MKMQTEQICFTAADQMCMVFCFAYNVILGVLTVEISGTFLLTLERLRLSSDTMSWQMGSRCYVRLDFLRQFKTDWLRRLEGLVFEKKNDYKYTERERESWKSKLE